jgi:hypothetical protein
MRSFLPEDGMLQEEMCEVLSRIHVVNCFDHEQLMGLLHQLREDVQWAGRGVPATGD